MRTCLSLTTELLEDTYQDISKAEGDLDWSATVPDY